MVGVALDVLAHEGALGRTTCPAERTTSSACATSCEPTPWPSYASSTSVWVKVTTPFSRR